MNKTLTVNIAGIVFHIEENAYNKLNQYLEAIKHSIISEERDEIIHDIELRIAELFSFKINDFNQVIVLNDVDEVIQIMGKPEDYKIEEERNANNKEDDTYYTFPKVKKLYRDTDNRMLGGVLAGMAHYFRMDVVWLRILFLILFFTFGTGFIFYIILWIVIPKAKTTTQKLEMKGEPINISSIEKKVTGGLKEVKKKINDIDYRKLKKNTVDTTNCILNIIKRIIGISILTISILGFITSVFFLILTFRNSNSDSYFSNHQILEILNNNDGFPIWFKIIISFAAFLIPFIIFFLIGLKLIYSNIRYIGIICLSLSILWIIGILTIGIIMTDTNNISIIKTNFKEKYQLKKELIIPKNIDTLSIKLVDAAFFESIDKKISNHEIDFTQKNVDIDIEILSYNQKEEHSSINLIYKKENDITKKRKQILKFPDYKYEITNNTLILSNNLSYNNEDNDEYEEFNAKIKLYLPENSIIHIDEVIRKHIINNDELTQGNHYYKIQNENLECTDCQ